MTEPGPAATPKNTRRLLREVAGVLMVVLGFAAMMTAAILWGGWLAVLAAVGAASFVIGLALMTEPRPSSPESGT